jgi:hypothetical protein
MAVLELLVVSAELTESSSLRGRETGVFGGGGLKVVAGLLGGRPGVASCGFFWAFDRVFTMSCESKTENYDNADG